MSASNHRKASRVSPAKSVHAQIFSWRRLRAHGLGALLGVAGGWLGNAAGLPLGWLVGAMLACGVVASTGVRVEIPFGVRWIVLSIIGVYLGESFTPEVLDWLARSVITVLAMCLIVTFEVVVAATLMCKVLRCNAVTAFTACVPGGFSTMLLLAGEHGGDEEVVAIVQLVRMIIVILVITATVYFAQGAQIQELPQISIVPREQHFAVGLMLLGLLVGGITRLPVLCMFVPMALAAILQVSTYTNIILPREPLTFALVVLGISVGCQWRTLHGKKLLSRILTGTVLGVFLLAMTAISAYTLATLLDFDLLALALALAPGGVAEVSLIAVTHNIEPSLVVLHHFLRLVFILACLPLVFTFLTKRIAQKQDDAL